MLSDDDQDLYDSIFTAAMECHNTAMEVDDQWGKAISGLMMAILNGWERNPKEFPERVIAETWNLAFRWYELTGGSDEPSVV